MGEKIRAIIYGSFIAYAIDSLLVKEDKSKGSVIRLKQAVISKIVKQEYVDYIKLSNKVWNNTVNFYADKNFKIIVPEFIETLGFHEEKIMKEFYGNNFLDLVGNFSLKLSQENSDRKILLETREFTDGIIKNAKKDILEYRGETNDETTD